MKCAVFDEWLCSMLLGNKPIIIGQVINIWKSYMRTAGWRIIWKKFIATFAVAKRKPEKIQAGGIRTLDLCDTGVALYQYWANKPTWSRSLNWFVINPWKDDDEVMNIWKSYMRTAGWRIKWKRITGRQVYVIAKVRNYSWQKLISSLLYFDFQRYLRVTLINCMGFCFLAWIVLILTRFERALSLLVQVISQRCHWPLKLMTSKAEQRWTGIGVGPRIG